MVEACKVAWGPKYEPPWEISGIMYLRRRISNLRTSPPHAQYHSLIMPTLTRLSVFPILLDVHSSSPHKTAEEECKLLALFVCLDQNVELEGA